MVKKASWPQTPIDRFLLARLEQAGQEPSPPADRRTLIRRATYDLTGLPPSPEEVDAFVQDSTPGAFARVVDRLLASPRYGERWGRYWLDVARYSDTKGYIYDREEKRFVHAHVYRDWVIRALNEDLPYDQFLFDQIAGDQVATVAGTENGQAAQASPLAGLGFLTVGRRFLGVRHDIIDDRIDVLMRGTLGLTVACARCHDHKYDPISMRDYYSLYGIFNSSTERTVRLSPAGRAGKEAEAFERGLREREERLQTAFLKKREQLTERLRAKAGDYLRAVLDVSKLPSEEFYAIMSADDLNPVVVRQWESYLFKSRGAFNPVFAPWQAWARLAPPEFPQRAGELLRELSKADRDPGERVNRLVLEEFRDRIPTSMVEVAERYGKLLAGVDQAWRRAQAAAGSNAAAAPKTLSHPDEEALRQVLYGPGSPAAVPNGAIIDMEWFFDEPSRVELARLQADIERWMLNAPGAPPHAVILADRPEPKNARIFLRGNPANPGEEVPRRFLEVLSHPGQERFTQGSGRLELARAIASRDNPLTARVLVNRVWLHHFGAGLVRTPSDFGTRAETPSHPELLDWLAGKFMDDGWSIKRLHRLILLSAAYQQRSGAGPATAAADPSNRLLGRMNEGRLDFEAMRDSLLATSGELDVRAGGPAVELFAAQPRQRRSIYGYIDRQFVPGILRLFDFANPDLHIPQRSETTVPQQALFFMNSPFVLDRARALAARASAGRAAAPDRVRELYRTAFQREPTAEQLQAGLEFVRAAEPEVRPPASPPPPTQWRYGFGAYDPSSQRITNFASLPHFTGDAWQGGAAWPDPRLGWVQITAEGGHAGDDLQHAAIRRWVAPQDGFVSIRGTVKHEHVPGDGITARIISSRHGLLGSWALHNEKAETSIARTEIRRGDTLDFVVDYRENLNSDMFKWAPLVGLLDGEEGGPGGMKWSAKSEFSGPLVPPPPPLSAWEKYAQVLLLSNEFLFID
jgi:hypothetical protein